MASRDKQPTRAWKGDSENSKAASVTCTVTNITILPFTYGVTVYFLCFYLVAIIQDDVLQHRAALQDAADDGVAHLPAVRQVQPNLVG